MWVRDSLVYHQSSLSLSGIKKGIPCLLSRLGSRHLNYICFTKSNISDLYFKITFKKDINYMLMTIDVKMGTGSTCIKFALDSVSTFSN